MGSMERKRVNCSAESIGGRKICGHVVQVVLQGMQLKHLGHGRLGAGGYAVQVLHWLCGQRVAQDERSDGAARGG